MRVGKIGAPRWAGIGDNGPYELFVEVDYRFFLLTKGSGCKGFEDVDSGFCFVGYFGGMLPEGHTSIICCSRDLGGGGNGYWVAV